jgi:hypothetical protein
MTFGNSAELFALDGYGLLGDTQTVPGWAHHSRVMQRTGNFSLLPRRLLSGLEQWQIFGVIAGCMVMHHVILLQRYLK